MINLGILLPSEASGLRSRLFCRPFSPRFFLMHLKCNPLSRSPGSIFPGLKRKRAPYYQLEVLHFLTGKYKSPLLPTESLQAFFGHFEKNSSKFSKNLSNSLKTQLFANYKLTYAQKSPEVDIFFAQKFAQT